MKNLHVGDYLLGYDFNSGSAIFSEMPTWFHFERNKTSDYIVIETNNGSLTTSPSHNIAISSQNKMRMYIHASNITINDNLIGLSYSSKNIQ